MSEQPLARVRLDNGAEVNMSREHAKLSKIEILDESAYLGDGTTRPETRRNSRPVKPKTTVSNEAGKKRGAPAASDAEEAPA